MNRVKSVERLRLSAAVRGMCCRLLGVAYGEGSLQGESPDTDSGLKMSDPGSFGGSEDDQILPNLKRQAILPMMAMFKMPDGIQTLIINGIQGINNSVLEKGIGHGFAFIQQIDQAVGWYFFKTVLAGEKAFKYE